MAYVYRHIRLDKNIPFYVGIGSQDDYYRAYSDLSRNKWWHHIVAKAGYKVEIILDGISWEEANVKEVEYISLYGRKTNGGTLCNLTDGGGGSLGLIVSVETRKKQSNQKAGKVGTRLGIPCTQEAAEKISQANRGKRAWNKGAVTKQESIDKRAASMAIAGYKTGENHPMFGKTHSDELKARWRVSRKGVMPWNTGKSISFPHLLEIQIERRMSVCQYDMSGALLNTFSSICEASDKTGAGKGNISLCCQGKRISAGGYKWGKK